MNFMTEDYVVRISRNVFTLDGANWLNQTSKPLKDLGTVLTIIESENPTENPLAPPRGTKLRRVDVTRVNMREIIYTAYYDNSTFKEATGDTILRQYHSAAL